MNIFINDQPRQLEDGGTVASLVEQLGVKPEHVAVEVNLELIPRRRHADHKLRDGDRLEVVTLVGGG